VSQAFLPPPIIAPLAKCGCKKHALDLSPCTVGATKAHDWMVGALGPWFRTAGHDVRTQNAMLRNACRQQYADNQNISFLPAIIGQIFASFFF